LETRPVSAAAPPDGGGAQTSQATLATAAALHRQGRLAEADALYHDILRGDPRHFDALHLRGVIALQTRRWEEGVALVRDAIALNGSVPEAHDNLGNGLRELHRFDEALASFDRAIALRSGDARLHRNRGSALQGLGRHEEALASYATAFALQPDLEFLPGMLAHTRMTICDWSDLQRDVAALEDRIERGETASLPFPLIALSDSPRLQRKAAEIYVRAMCPANAALPEIGRRPGHDRLRVGYFSADFHNHATAYLMAELFERHDARAFEITAFSFGPDSGDAMRQRLLAGFHRFIDVRNRSDLAVALLSRELGIDIAVDLKGFTQNFRTGIFACRAAPIQANYLGYPGTMGADYIDYILADPILVAEAEQQHYAEKIVWLPDSYQVNDTRRRIADRTPSRAEAGLPPDGFVFCCFNQSLKITPDVFDGWMRILRRVAGSVLWLLHDNDAAVANLRRAATQRGVAADRLVFAPRQPLPEHLARHRLAGLFLDTAPYNAHTTASDALWAGLPVLTRMGATFAGRVAASLVNAVGLGELITTTPDAYEAKAIVLATNPDALAAVRQTLERNRLTAPLFDTGRFTTYLESAYRAMAARYQAGLPPAPIRVPATATIPHAIPPVSAESPAASHGPE
jgi:predicted O-linked N-acetylglucosamine transferase (SPINDLY family)